LAKYATLSISSVFASGSISAVLLLVTSQSGSTLTSKMVMMTTRARVATMLQYSATILILYAISYSKIKSPRGLARSLFDSNMNKQHCQETILFITSCQNFLTRKMSLIYRGRKNFCQPPTTFFD